jgi:hypothetical protein
MSVAILVSCQVEVSMASRSLVQRNPTQCGVSVFDLETSTMRWQKVSGWCIGMCVDIIKVLSNAHCHRCSPKKNM